MSTTLQITLAPFDVRHARHTLGHLVRTWGPQVEEVLLVVDYRESPFRARQERSDAARALAELGRTIDCLAHPGLRVVQVDRSRAERRRVAARFGARRLPESDFRGRPYYSYLFGLAAARHARVLHVDSDMLFGGGSSTWIAEADAWFARDPTLVACSPLPGPPAARGVLHGQENFPYTREGEAAYRFTNMSTRVFLADMDRVDQRLGSLAGRHIRTARSVVGSALRGQVNWLTLEERMTLAMRSSGSGRLDFLGRAPGMWSVHPLERTPEFHANLEALIAHLEAGRPVTDLQRGHYDLHPSMLALAAGSG